MVNVFYVFLSKEVKFVSGLSLSAQDQGDES